MSWTEAPAARLSRDGRLRLTHGPIDAILTAEGPADAVRAAYLRARDAFAPVLGALALELPRLRAAHGPEPRGAVAQRMLQATGLFAPIFVTPMAAVAGAVADHLLTAMMAPGHGLQRASVNNGGDIALWTMQKPWRIAICEDPVAGLSDSRAEIGPGDGIGGVATSGWRGRSQSLGFADAVTVLAGSAAAADAAATLIANAVDLPGHPAIARRPARDLHPDSDLGDRPVTIGVGRLSAGEVQTALARGVARAEAFRRSGLIIAACLACQGARRMIGADLMSKEPAHA